MKFYKPSLLRERMNNYTAVLKLLPNKEGSEIATVNQIYLKHPFKNESRWIKCPSSIGEPSPFKSLFFKLRDLNISDRQYVNRVVSNYCFAEIIADEQHPEFIGETVIFNFTNSILKKILDCARHNAFDTTDKYFLELNIFLNDGYPNYSDSEMVYINDMDFEQKNKMLDNSLLERLTFEEWNKSTINYVAEVLYYRFACHNNEEVRQIYKEVIEIFEYLKYKEK